MLRYSPLFAALGICLVPFLMGQNNKDGIPQPPQLTAVDIAAMAPVKSVNTQTGDVVVQTFQRAVGTLSSFTTANGYTQGTWNYTTKVNGVDTPFTFAAPPRCFMQIKSATTTATYSYPIVTNVTTTSVTFKFTASPLSLNVSVFGALSLLTTMPADVSVDILCLNPI